MTAWLKRVSLVGLMLLVGIPVLSPAAFAAEFVPLPGADEMPAETQAAIKLAWEIRNPKDAIRSRHLREDGTPLYANRLLAELSPYLNQHAHNPVNWYPWGNEAFAAAANRDLPVLVSIGYSACHWCHVMEEESYDNLEIATFLNEHYVAVKVDRETSPDIDELYLLAVQIMGGYGGWPLHVFITAEGKPFLGMTYVPPAEFEAVLKDVHQVWMEKRSEVENLASLITDEIQAFGLRSGANVELGRQQIEQFIAELDEQDRMIDEFSPPTSSFPSETELFLLLDAALRYEDKTALRLAEKRLTGMALGGIRDHIGGGFHRYTIDNEWLVPHFEKMLYNQAHLARAYLIAYGLTGKALYRRVAEQTLDYVLRDMRDANGAFWSATDADSEGEEGLYFIWTPAEIVEAVGADAEFVIEHYGVTEAGNFAGANILHLAETPEAQALALGTDVAEYLARLTPAVEKMRMVRERREKPYLDDKIITAWNAMMITTLARSESLHPDGRYLKAAVKAAEYLWDRLWDASNTRLYRIQRKGQLGEVGKLKDYAYFAEALLTLYDETAEVEWLNRGQTLVNAMLTQFWDRERGGFFSVGEDEAEGLIVRHKDRFDEALPSGNSVAARSLAMLYQRTGKRIYARTFELLFQAFGGEIAQIPTSYSYAMNALEEFRGGSVGPREYAASGNAKVAFDVVEELEGRVRATVTIDLADGWHIQSDQPLAENLFATRLSSASENWPITHAAYPPAEEINLSFQDNPLSVWSGTVEIPVEFDSLSKPDSVMQLDVRLQACNDEVCLLPETVRLEMPPGRLRG